MRLPHKSTFPLSHLIALDLADESATFCTKILASLGALVIKIEKPIGLDGNTSPDNASGLRNGSFFQFTNTDKYSITLNLNNSRGRSILRRLAAAADVLVETFPPGYLNRLNLGYRNLNKINPRLIMASVSGFGQKGPCSRFVSNDMIASACGGQMYLTGEKDRTPLPVYGRQPYFTASLFAAVGILLALQDRNKTNKGQHIDLSLQETAAAALGYSMIRYFQDATVSRRSGRMQASNPGGIFPCRDGYIYLTFEREWDTLLDWLSAEGMQADLGDKRWQNAEFRRRHQSHIAEILSRWTKTHRVDELFHTAQTMRFPWAPVNTISQLLHNPQLKARGFFKRTGFSKRGKPALCPDLPLSSFSSRRKAVRDGTQPGKHNYLVYRKLLGYSRKKVDELSRFRVI